ncbi:adenylate/guanylate cyclase domain-containing protein [Actinoplanes sp. NPDC049596]|uniref:adenylate/guanylate cyclase domain-containing protein n=1 Tax=unclassified Actinoplanes TaxID=2626549 RepID=UPI00341328F0
MKTLTQTRDGTSVVRRHVAVLFADLSGFTALVETVPPEMVYERVAPRLDELALLVTEHGGLIQQVLGDGFMAVFGLGPAGDEVTCAVQAALRVVRAGGDAPPGLPVHVGVECGEVLVSPSWESARYGVWGRAVTVASRLCDRAGPGSVYVGPQAARRGGDHILRTWPYGSTTVLRTRLKGMTGEVVVHASAPKDGPA